MLVSVFSPGNWRQEIKKYGYIIVKEDVDQVLLTWKYRVRNFNKFLTGTLGNGRKGQKNVYPVFDNVILMSSIVSCFIYIVFPHQTIKGSNVANKRLERG